MPISFKTSGSFKKTEKFLDFLKREAMYSDLESYGQLGVQALASATPVETGLTAHSWSYKITRKRGGASIEWFNTNTTSGIPVVILIQYGHGTGTGGYVRGRDFINPAIQPIFDRIANQVWEKVTNG